jgi:hypothetical protein
MEYSQATADELEQIMREIPGAKASKMFGMPAYKVNGKLAVGIFEDGIVAKLGKARTAEIVGKDGVEYFEPNGRTWKDWIRVNSNFSQHRALLEEAVRYVAENS